MITQELLAYIRGEFAKGRTREEIHQTLIGSGGWSTDDLSEAFRTIIPMPNIVLSTEKPIRPPVTELSAQLPPMQPTQPSITPSATSSITTPFSPSAPPSFSSLRSFSPLSSSRSPLKSAPLSATPSSPRAHSSLLKYLIILIIIGGLGFGAWYYRSLIMKLWGSLVSKPTAQQTINDVKKCGTGVTPKLDIPSTYENDLVLSCLGESALNCENAEGILKDDLFPTFFEITKSDDSCNFKLSYAVDSPLIDITGKKLALQYISCPIGTVKAIDNTDPASVKFNVPDKTNSGKYASQIYLYGALGLFLENNLDPSRIQALGCSGEYIQTMIESYRAEKTKI